MRYLTLCTDYDGTIAHNGRVDAATIAALEELRASGRKLVLVTGREIDDLQKVFDRIDLFERVVAENGALIYRPSELAKNVCCMRRRRPVSSRSCGGVVSTTSPSGRCIVATWEPHERHGARDNPRPRPRAPGRSSTRARSWYCPAASTRPPACAPHWTR